MAITTSRLDYLLNEGYDEEDTILVHGTSVEAIQILIQTNYLPNNKNTTPKEYAKHHPVHNGYLYFIPIKKSFKHHPLYSQINDSCTQAWAEREAAGYAQLIQVRQIGYNYCEEHISPRDLMLGNRDGPNIPRKTQLKIPWDDKEFKHSIANAKGVLIGLSLKIFELEIQAGSDEPDQEVMIHLPQGLHHSYLHYILPLGKTEELQLQNIRENLS